MGVFQGQGPVCRRCPKTWERKELKEFTFSSHSGGPQIEMSFAEFQQSFLQLFFAKVKKERDFPQLSERCRSTQLQDVR